VQSEKFVESHAGKLGDVSIYGQESNATSRPLGCESEQLKQRREGTMVQRRQGAKKTRDGENKETLGVVASWRFRVFAFTPTLPASANPPPPPKSPRTAMC
jgi:hypothetical protein